MLDILALRGGTATARVLSGAKLSSRVISTIDPDYANGTALPQPIEGITNSLSSFHSATNGFLTDLKKRALDTLKAMYAIDVQAASSSAPLAQLTSGFTLEQALIELNRQMVASSDSLQSGTVSAGAQTAVGTPTGNAVIVVSMKNVKGVTLALAFPETITFRCTGDAQSGSATAGNEPVRITGQAAVSDTLSHLWPGGSGVSTSLNAVDGSKNNSTGNLLQNSDFFTATTANNTDNWSLGIGVAGTDVFQTTSASNVYTSGGGAVEFLGTGSALLDGITQSFGVSPSTTVGAGGTSATLKPNTVYHFSLWYKLTAASPSTGALQVSLTDGSAYPGTVLSDDATTVNTVTQSLTGVADTDWHNLTGAFRTPAVLPTTSPVAKLRVRLSTAIESGKGVFIGRLSLAQATQIYAGGPFVTIHSGNTRLINGLVPDAWTVAISNNFATSGSGLMHFMMERVFGLREKGIQLPIAGSPTVADSLVA